MRLKYKADVCYGTFAWQPSVCTVRQASKDGDGAGTYYGIQVCTLSGSRLEIYSCSSLGWKAGVLPPPSLYTIPGRFLD